MASFATHFSTFLCLFPIGFHRMYCSFSLYLKDPSHYRSKTWFFMDPKWKNLNFYALLILLPIASFTDLVFFLSLSGHPSYRFAFLQNGAFIFMMWACLIVIFLRESFDLFVVNEGFVFVFAGVCFLVEYFINGNGFTGVSIIVYDFLGNLTLVCAFSCLYLAIKPSSFLADFCLSSGIMLKGSWVLQAGLNLYTQMFVFKGCQVLSLMPEKDMVDVRCDLDEDGLRGVALMNLLFVWHAIVVLITSFVVFGLLAYKESLRCGEGSGPLLVRIQSRSSLLQPLPEFELE